MMLADAIKLAQRPGTDALLKDYLSPFACERDTITAFFFIPSACPRCEATIAPSVKCLKSASPKETVVLVVCHPDSEASKIYVDNLAIGEDIRVYDTGYDFDKIFSTTMGGLQGLFVARIDMKSGRMITGGEHNFVSEDFFKELLAVRTPLPLHTYDTQLAEYRNDSSEKEKERFSRNKVFYKTYPLELFSNKPAQIRNHPIVRDNTLVFLDIMCTGGLELKYTKETEAYQLTMVR